MTESDIRLKTQEMIQELKKLRLESKLHKSLSSELKRQKMVAVEAKDLAITKTEELDVTIKKLKIESQLRKNLSSEFERQKEIAVEAQDLALEKKNEIEAISNQLSKYLSPQLYQSIFSGKQQVDIVSKRKKLTVFFSDIVGFTSISDSLESEEITAMLNYYLTEMSVIAFEYGATIDKYVGDAIVIFFGDPDTAGVQQDALNCVKMAVAMQNKMRDLESQWAQKFSLKEPLQIRIGVNTGYCTVGNFGSEDRLDYTVIGGQVNLAARLESIAKPGSILISFDTHSQILDEIECKEVEKVQVKGIKEEIRVFEVLLSEMIKSNHIKLETENSQCSMNISALRIDEIDKLHNFLEEARQQITGNNRNPN